MEIRSVLPGVNIHPVRSVSRVNDIIYSDENHQVNQHEFALQVAGVGSFYARDGKEVEYFTEPDADPDWVKLYLNGQVLVALLHQRKTLNFHASSFVFKRRGIMLLGETGAGKSSVTTSFVLEGAGFLSDDLTPIVFNKSKPYIKPLRKAIKLREHTIDQLDIGSHNLTDAETGTGKQYLHIGHSDAKDFPLHSVFIIEIGDTKTPEFYTPEPAQKFALLRSEICSWEILAGMPETEATYLEQVLQIVQTVNIVKVVRPADIKVPVLHVAISDYIEMNAKEDKR